MPTAKINSKGAIAIPRDLREKYNLTKGTRVVFVDYGGVLTIVPAMTNPIKQTRGMLKGDPSLLEALKQERAWEREREDKERFV